MSRETIGTVCHTRGGRMTAETNTSKPLTGIARRHAIEDREYNDAEYQNLLKLYEGTLGTISEGEIVKGRVVAIGETNLSVDIGFKSEGVVALAEFTNRDELKVGDEIEVF